MWELLQETKTLLDFILLKHIGGQDSSSYVYRIFGQEKVDGVTRLTIEVLEHMGFHNPFQVLRWLSLVKIGIAIQSLKLNGGLVISRVAMEVHVMHGHIHSV
jgi:hypothetical protein